MGEVSRRAQVVVARAAGNTVSPAVTALLAAAGAALGNPALVFAAAPIGALAGSITEEGAALVSQVWQDRSERVGRFADSAASEAGVTFEVLCAEAMTDPRQLELLVRAGEAAARSLDGRKIDMLARVYVSATKDQAVVDDSLLLIDVLRQLEAPHLRLLAVLSRRAPVVDRLGLDGELCLWEEGQILKADPGLRQAFYTLIAKLHALGLAREDPGVVSSEPIWELTDMGRACVKHLVERGDVAQNGLT